MIRFLIKIFLLIAILQWLSVRIAADKQPTPVLSSPTVEKKVEQEHSVLVPKKDRFVAPVEPTPTPEEKKAAKEQESYRKLGQQLTAIVPLLDRVAEKLEEIKNTPIPPTPPPIPPKVEEPQPEVKEIPKAQPPEPVLVDWVDSYQDAKAKSLELKRPILMTFSETGCYFCEVLHNTTLTDPQLKKHLATNFILQRVFLSKESGVPSTPGAQSFVSNFGIRKWPTVVVYNPATNTYKKAEPSSKSFYEPDSFLRTVDSLAATVK